MADSFAQLNAKLSALAKDLGDVEVKKRVARESLPDIEDAVRATLGDLSMSRWAVGNPVEIVGRVLVQGDQVSLEPVSKAKGPMRVLQDGRQGYAAGDMRNSGTYTSKKTGVTRQKRRKVKKATGAHGGKGTWTDATNRVQSKYAERYDNEVVKALGKRFTRG